ncbi:MAG: DUF4396 domain-containing protein [Rubricella sp.]
MAHAGQSTWPAAFHATLHCATGCVAGEITGLAIGVSLGWPVLASMALAVVLAFVFGLSLATFPLARREGIAPLAALKMIWLGESVSIATMEIVMNAVDYWLGGASAGSVFSSTFWIALAVAIPVGFAATLPVNYVMIRRGLGNHAH